MSRKHRFIYNSSRWRMLRIRVFQRDDYRCCSCGKPGPFECDHIVPLHKNPKQDPYDPDGLQTLCRGCHIEKTRQENQREFTPGELAWGDLVSEMMG